MTFMVKSILFLTFFLGVSFDIDAMHGQIAHPHTINLNEVQDFFELRTAAANLVKADTLLLPHVFAPNEPNIRNILALLPQQNTQVRVIKIGDYQERLMCTKQLTNHMLTIWFLHYKDVHYFNPYWSNNDPHFFTEVFDGVALAMRTHGVL